MRTKLGTAKSLANKEDFWPALYRMFAETEWRRECHPTPFEIKVYFPIFGFLPTFLPTTYRANDGEQTLSDTSLRHAVALRSDGQWRHRSASSGKGPNPSYTPPPKGWLGTTSTLGFTVEAGHNTP